MHIKQKAEELNCVAGCKYFHGGEIYHHKDCLYYSESFSEMYDKLKRDYEVLKSNTQWNSPTEKPETERQNEEYLLLMYDGQVKYHDIGYFDEKIHSYHSEDEHIISWQYLPSIK